MKRILTIELDYDAEQFYEDNEGREWFDKVILGGPLILHSNELGDEIGEARVIDDPYRARAEKAEAALSRIKQDGDKVLRYPVGHRCDYYNYAMSCRDRATQALADKGE